MDYDSIFDEIGHFGRWQQINFFLGSLCAIGSSLICFMFSFVGYTPDFRCYIPECDGERNSAVYKTNFTALAIPGNEDEKEMDGPYHCSQYAYENASTILINITRYTSSCSAENFNHNITQVCQQHIYDESQYKFPITKELDLSPCKSSSDYWNLEVSTLSVPSSTPSYFVILSKQCIGVNYVSLP